MLTGATVEEILAKDDGWPYERIDGHTWRSGFRGEVNSFRFFLRLTDNWIFFTIVPFVVAPKHDAQALALYYGTCSSSTAKSTWPSSSPSMTTPTWS